MSDSGNDTQPRISVMGSELKRGQALELTPLHKTIIALKSAGLSRKEIAEVLKIDPVTITNVTKHPDAQPILARLTADHVSEVSRNTRQSIEATAFEAFLKVRNLMQEAKSETVQMNCAFDIMDRAGFKPKEAAPIVQVALGENAGVFLEAIREMKNPVEELPQLESSEGVFGTASNRVWDNNVSD